MSRQHSANDEHHSGHPETTGDQRLLAAKAVDTNVEEDCGCDHFDGAVDSGGEHGRVRFAEADRLEDLRGVAGSKDQSKPEDVDMFGAETYYPMELVPENCCQNMIMKAIRKRLRLPGVRHSFQVTPSVALSSSSIDALISAISMMIWGSSTVLHRM